MYSALGSFVLYLLGYLALRFHLTVLGVATDLAVLDERYLFAGANCLVYLASMLPIAVLVAALLAAPAYGLYRLLPSAARDAVRGRGQRFIAKPAGPTALGIVLAVGFIQLLMRQCFAYGNLLVRAHLPEVAPWLHALFVHDEYMPLYFSTLILGALLTGALLARSLADDTAPSLLLRLSRALLGTLFAIQVLLLPVNYGVLVHYKSLARVTAVGSHALAAGDQAWLAWEGKDSITYFVKRVGGERSLITFRNDAIKEVEITGYDRVATLLPPMAPAEEELHADRK
jgi:hypothetical protein